MNENTVYDQVDFIGDISDSLIQSMLKVMKPCDCVRPNRYREIDIEGVDPRGVSFIWNPKLVGPEFAMSPLTSTQIPSFHTYGAPSLFKQTLAECLAAIHRYMKDCSRVRFFAVESNLGIGSIIGSYHESRIRVCSQPMVEMEHFPGRLEPMKFKDAG